MTDSSAFSIPEPLCVQEKKARKFGIAFLITLSLLPVLGVLLPRSLAFGPGIAGLVFFLWFCILYKKRPPLNFFIIATTGGALTLSFASILWALDPEQAINRSLKLAGTIVPGLFLLYLAASIPQPVLRRHLWAFPAALIFCIVLLSFEYIFDFPLYRFFRGMEGSEYVQRAGLNRSSVVALLLLFPVTGMLAIGTGKGKLALFIALACLFLPVLIMTESQSIQLAFLIGIAFLFLFPYRRAVAWYGLIALITACLLLAPFLSIWAFDNYAARINTLPMLGQGSGANAAHRLEIWDFVSRYALQNPLYGFGIEATRAIEAFDTQNIYHQEETVLHPHNFAIQIWIEFGLVGILLSVAFLGLLILKIKKLDLPQQRIGLTALMTSLSVGSTGYGLWQSWWIGLLLLVSAVTILTIRLASDHRHLA